MDFENYWEAPERLWVPREVSEREMEAVMVSDRLLWIASELVADRRRVEVLQTYGPAHSMIQRQCSIVIISPGPTLNASPSSKTPGLRR